MKERQFKTKCDCSYLVYIRYEHHNHVYECVDCGTRYYHDIALKCGECHNPVFTAIDLTKNKCRECLIYPVKSL